MRFMTEVFHASLTHSFTLRVGNEKKILKERQCVDSRLGKQNLMFDALANPVGAASACTPTDLELYCVHAKFLGGKKKTPVENPVENRMDNRSTLLRTVNKNEEVRFKILTPPPKKRIKKCGRSDTN